MPGELGVIAKKNIALDFTVVSDVNLPTCSYIMSDPGLTAGGSAMESTEFAK
jgi:hypothetical protein